MTRTNQVHTPPGLEKSSVNRWAILEDREENDDRNQRQKDLREMELPKVSLGDYEKDFPRVSMGNYSKKTKAQPVMINSTKNEIKPREISFLSELNVLFRHEAYKELNPCINAASSTGGWKYVKGVMDSGATDSVIHPSECEEYEIQESPGSKAGQNWTSASGGVIPNLGQKILDVVTEDGIESQVKYQAADVSRTLNSITEICDAGGEEGQYVIFSKWGGTVYNPTLKRQTPFEREGGIYTMGMWVKPKLGFTRPAV